MAEVEALRAALAEANRSKAALASRLQQARSESATLAARLQASQARRSAELAAQAAVARQAGGEAWAEVAQLRAEKQQLEVQVCTYKHGVLLAGRKGVVRGQCLHKLRVAVRFWMPAAAQERDPVQACTACLSLCVAVVRNVSIGGHSILL